MTARPAPLTTPDAIAHAIDAVSVAELAVSWLNDRIYPVVVSLLELSKCDGLDGADVRYRMGLVHGLAKVGRRMIEEAGGDLEQEQAELQEKLATLKGVQA